MYQFNGGHSSAKSVLRLKPCVWLFTVKGLNVLMCIPGQRATPVGVRSLSLSHDPSPPSTQEIVV